MKTLDQIFNEAKQFVNDKFDGEKLRSAEWRITMLSIMKMKLELVKLEHNLALVENMPALIKQLLTEKE